MKWFLYCHGKAHNVSNTSLRKENKLFIRITQQWKRFVAWIKCFLPLKHASTRSNINCFVRFHVLFHVFVSKRILHGSKLRVFLWLHSGRGNNPFSSPAGLLIHRNLTDNESIKSITIQAQFVIWNCWKKKLAKTDSRKFILNKANILARTRLKFQEIAYSAIHLRKENGSHEKSLGDCETKGVLGQNLRVDCVWVFSSRSIAFSSREGGVGRDNL